MPSSYCAVMPTLATNASYIIEWIRLNNVLFSPTLPIFLPALPFLGRRRLCLLQKCIQLTRSPESDGESLTRTNRCASLRAPPPKRFNETSHHANVARRSVFFFSRVEQKKQHKLSDKVVDFAEKSSTFSPFFPTFSGRLSTLFPKSPQTVVLAINS